MTASSGPQPLAIRRLVRDSAGNTRIMLVDAYSYQPVNDPSGYKVVDVQDVPEQVASVSTPDAEKPVSKDVKVASNDHNGSEFAGSLGRDANQSPGFNNAGTRNVSPSAPSRAHPGAFPSAPQLSSGPITRAPAPPSAPSTPTQTPSTPAQSNNPPGYSQPSSPSFGNTQDTTPSPSSSDSSQASTGPNDMNNNGAYGADQGYGWGGTNNTTNWGGYGGTATSPGQSTQTSSSVSGQGFGTPAGMGNTVDASSFGGYTSQSGNNNGRGAGAYFSNSGPAIGNEPSPSAPSTPSQSSYGSMYGDVGYGGGYTPDNDIGQQTVSSAGTPQSAAERSSIASAANTPAANAARGMVTRSPAELDRIGLAIAGEVTPKTLSDLSSPDPSVAAAARQQVADVQTTMENRAALSSVDQSVTPGMYDSLDTGKNLNTSKNNFAKFQDPLMQTIKDYYTGLNLPTDYSLTNYANTKPFPGYTPPGWLSRLQNTAIVGPFTFGTDPMYSNPSKWSPDAQANYSATMANLGSLGAYQASPDFGPSAAWGGFASPFDNPSNPNNGFGYGYGQSAVDPGWGGFAGGVYSGGIGDSSGAFGGDNSDSGSGGYSSNSGNGNGRGSSGSGYGGPGNSNFGGGGYSSNSGNGNGRGSSGAGYGGSSSGSGGYSSSSGNGNGRGSGLGGMGYGGGGYGGQSSDGGDENGDTGGGGAGTRSNGAGGYGGL